MDAKQSKQDKQPVESFFFSFSFNAGGIIDSNEGIDKTREHLRDNLRQVYGEDGATIKEFRIATPAEVQAVLNYTTEGEAKTVN